jgi:heme/copper-type cytochrome/quinol oxidase subunit 1
MVLCFPSSYALDIQVHDTYFVVALHHLFITSAIVWLLLWGLYELLARYRLLPSQSLQYLHISAFLLPYAVFLLLFSDSLIASFPRRYYSFTVAPEWYADEKFWYLLLWYYFWLAQTVFFGGVIQKSLL